MNLLQRIIAVLVCTLLMAGLTACGSSTDSKVTTLKAAVSDFPNGGLLVSGDSLQDSLGVKGLIVIDARSATAYNAGHIPGAINVLWSDYRDAAAMGLKDTATLATQLGAKGITRDATIVIYDDTVASWGAAGRIFWMLDYLDCNDIHILNGGWDKWVADGKSTQTTAVTLKAATFTPADTLRSGIVATKAHIRDRLNAPDFVVVDTRTDEEYMGWQMYGEPKAGHITNAVQLPYGWYYNSDKTTKSYADLKNLFESKGVTPDKEVAAYCTVGIRSAHAYFLLRMMGYSRCANYDGSIVEWGTNQSAQLPALPMEKAPNFSTIVYPQWVKQVMDYHATGSTTAAPPEYKDPGTGTTYPRSHKYLIFETQWGSFDDMAQGWADTSYLTGHIPGAIHSNSDVYENGYPRWFTLPDTELKTAVGSMGISDDTTVIVYSNSSIFAARLWWILKYAGVKDVRFLNGGYAAWTKAGYTGETTKNLPTPVTYTGTTHPEYVATTAYAEAHYQGGDNSATLVDVRRWIEYIGEISGYGYVENKGRIPGAKWGYDADDSSYNYIDTDGTLRNYNEVKSFWKNTVGLQESSSTTFTKEVLFYCGSGYRSSVTFLQAYLMGYTNIRNYSDGWEGWSTNYTYDAGTDTWSQPVSGRPVAFGAP